MDKQEFFLLIPAIIYGVAIVDLMKIFRHKNNYWEIVAWGVYIFMVIIFVWAELYQKLHALTSDIKNFFIIIIQAVVYAQLVAVITPEEKDINTKDYFLKNRKLFFLMISLALIVNTGVSYLVFEDHRASWVRPTALGLSLLCAFWDNRWLRTAIWAFFFGAGLFIIFG
ncbi:MAG: hypothetical protein OCD76_02760 [Reichenbachiella sp.]